jgi:phosphohistidine phosphatase
MRVYIIRHASAVQEGPGISDEMRYLTRQGRDDCRILGRLLRDEGHSFDVVLTSPLVRAVQTAELIADGVDYLGEVQSFFGLRPGSFPRAVAEEIANRGGSVAVVGHAPDVSSIGAYLVGQPGFVPFRTGQVCLIEDGAPRWKLRADVRQYEDLFIPG